MIKRVIARIAERKDISDINLAEICRACKLTTGAVYFHFKGKEEAIEEMAIDEFTAIYGGLVAQGADLSFDQLARLIVGETTRFQRSRKMLAKALQVVINTRPRAYAAWTEARRPLLAELERAIAQRRHEAGLPVESAAYLAVFLLNAMEDLAMDAYQWSNPSLAPYAKNDASWVDLQSALWSHAILAPLR